MHRTVSKLKGFTIGAKDGDIGKVDDVLFDDNLWTVRYLAVDTAKWLPGRQVVISPVAIDKLDWEGQRVPVSLTKEQVEKSPALDSQHLSREHERLYYDFYGWPYYWIGGDVWGAGLYPGELALAGRVTTPAELPERGDQDPHLRSAKEVGEYYIEATDGDIGHVEDFIIDDETWEIRYMVVDTKNWWPGKKVIVSPEWIERVSWADSRVYVDLSRDAIQSGPQFDPDQLNRDYEAKLYKHYDRPTYWDL
jgi:sporulation protein YlmC with PRC-barrel domain